MINQPKNPYAKTDTPSTLMWLRRALSWSLKKTYRIHLKEVRWKIWLIKYLVVVDLFKVNFPIQASWIQSTCANWTVFFIFFFITKMTCISFLVYHKKTNEIPCFGKRNLLYKMFWNSFHSDLVIKYMKYMVLWKIECEMQMSCFIYLNQVIQKIKDDKLMKNW